MDKRLFCIYVTIDILPIERPSSPVTTNNLVVVLSGVFVWLDFISRNCGSYINYTKHKKCNNPVHCETNKKVFQEKRLRFVRNEKDNKIPSSTTQ